MGSKVKLTISIYSSTICQHPKICKIINLWKAKKMLFQMAYAKFRNSFLGEHKILFPASQNALGIIQVSAQI